MSVSLMVGTTKKITGIDCSSALNMVLQRRADVMLRVYGMQSASQLSFRALLRSAKVIGVAAILEISMSEVFRRLLRMVASHKTLKYVMHITSPMIPSRSRDKHVAQGG